MIAKIVGERNVRAAARRAIIIAASIFLIIAERVSSAPMRVPAVPHEDWGACPFECCSYGGWVAQKITPAFTLRSTSAPIAFRLTRGDAVIGMTGADAPSALLGAFGFPDVDGARLIVADSLAAPESLTRAIAPGGRVYHIRYAGKQAEKPGGHQRATSQEFEFTEGHVFRVLRGHVETDASCLLTTDSLFAGCRPETLRTFESPPHCSAELVKRIADLRERAVVRSWILARLGSDRLVVLLEFERRGKQALGSLAIVSADAIGFNDYPAEVEKEGDSVYRVDDEGVMSPEGFEVCRRPCEAA